GYFSVGVWQGILKNGNRLQAVRSHWLWLAWAAMIVAISSLSAATTTGTLIGARGGLLALLSCGLVAVTARIRVPHALKGVAAWLGEISYPLYLLHMWAYRLLAVQVSPIRTWETDTPAAFALAVIALSCLMATVSYRFFELPFLTWGKRRLGTCQRL
ncbi:MAG TPA: hypothetical protein VGG33_21015, partial [Polyangia bacterium]